MLLFAEKLCLGYTGEPSYYQQLEPFLVGDSLRWELATDGQEFVDLDGMIYYLRERQIVPSRTLWLNLTLIGGDGKTPIGCNLNGSNPIQIFARLENDSGDLISYDWMGRILLYDRDGRPLDCMRCDLTQGQAHLEFIPHAAAVPHYLRSKDFDQVELPTEGRAIVKIRNEPIEIRVYR